VPPKCVIYGTTPLQAPCSILLAQELCAFRLTLYYRHRAGLYRVSCLTGSEMLEGTITTRASETLVVFSDT
jgi:hypothetical protein